MARSDQRLRTGRGALQQHTRQSASFRRVLKVCVNGAIALALVVVIGYNFTLGSVGIQVSDASASVQFRSAEQYNEITREAFRSSLFHRSKFTFSSASFEQELMARLPEINRVAAAVPLAGTKLRVGLEFTEPLLRIELENATQVGIVGTNGRLLVTGAANEPAFFSEYPLLRVTPVLPLAPGEQVLTTEEVALVSLLLSELDGSDTHRPVLESITYSIEQREFRVDFAAASYYAKLTIEHGAREQVGALVASLKDLPSDQPPTAYVDVRVPGRVFVQ